jgi:hypothetical protein
MRLFDLTKLQGNERAVTQAGDDRTQPPHLDSHEPSPKPSLYSTMKPTPMTSSTEARAPSSTV